MRYTLFPNSPMINAPSALDEVLLDFLIKKLLINRMIRKAWLRKKNVHRNGSHSCH